MKSAEGRFEPRVLQVADLIVDLQGRTVHKAGKRLPVKSRSFQLLEALMACYPETAGHRELMDGVWKGVVVSPDALSQRVRLLRKALGEGGGEAGYIVSEHGQGYRLAHPPRPVTETYGGLVVRRSDPRLRWGMIASAALLLALVVLIYAPHVIKHLFKHALMPT